MRGTHLLEIFYANATATIFPNASEAAEAQIFLCFIRETLMRGKTRKTMRASRMLTVTLATMLQLGEVNLCPVVNGVS